MPKKTIPLKYIRNVVDEFLLRHPVPRMLANIPPFAKNTSKRVIDTDGQGAYQLLADLVGEPKNTIATSVARGSFSELVLKKICFLFGIFDMGLLEDYVELRKSYLGRIPHPDWPEFAPDYADIERPYDEVEERRFRQRYWKWLRDEVASKRLRVRALQERDGESFAVQYGLTDVELTALAVTDGSVAVGFEIARKDYVDPIGWLSIDTVRLEFGLLPSVLSETCRAHLAALGASAEELGEDVRPARFNSAPAFEIDLDRRSRFAVRRGAIANVLNVVPDAGVTARVSARWRDIRLVEAPLESSNVRRLPARGRVVSGLKQCVINTIKKRAVILKAQGDVEPSDDGDLTPRARMSARGSDGSVTIAWHYLQMDGERL